MSAGSLYDIGSDPGENHSIYEPYNPDWEADEGLIIPIEAAAVDLFNDVGAGLRKLKKKHPKPSRGNF